MKKKKREKKKRQIRDVKEWERNPMLRESSREGRVRFYPETRATLACADTDAGIIIYSTARRNATTLMRIRGCGGFFVRTVQ